MKIFYLVLCALFITACTTAEQPDTVTQSPEAPEDYRTDQETWKTTDQKVILRGCKEWKQRNPDADC